MSRDYSNSSRPKHLRHHPRAHGECAPDVDDAIGDLLPSALAVALSPIPIIAIVLVLGAPHAGLAGPAFAVGWIAGLLAVSVIVVLLVSSGHDPDSDDPGLD